MKKLILVLFVFLFLFSFNLARADVVINEVAWMGTAGSQYEEWIELKNTGSESVSLAGWKLYKNSGTLLFSLSKTIPADGYFLICRTTASLTNPLSGTCDEQGVFGGSGLNNTSDLVQLKNASDAQVDSVDGMAGWPAGSADTKETMQKSGLVWITATPTPKIQNQTSSTPTTPAPIGAGALVMASANNDISLNNTKTETQNKVSEEPKIKTQIIGKNFGFVGMPVSLEAKTLGYSGEQLYSGKYFWNFSDGDSKEIKLSDSVPFSHVYFYPGEYVIYLDYYQNYYSEIPDASAQLNIKIIGADISISRVGDEKDFFIELTNNTDYNADISNWFLISDQKSFKIPRNTILGAKKKMIISSKITNFSIEDKNSLKLKTKEGEVVFDYLSFISPVLPKVIVSSKNTAPKVAINNLSVPVSQNEQVPIENLLASAVNSDVLLDDKKSSSSVPFIPIVSVVFVGASAYAVYFIRQKKVAPVDENDFEILDE